MSAIVYFWQKNAVRYVYLFLLGCTMACSHSLPFRSTDQNATYYFGTYTEKLGHVDGKASGIYCGAWDNQGHLRVIDSITGIRNPSFLCLSADRQYLYAVAENGGKPDEPFGSMVAYRLLPNHKAVKLNEQSSFGAAPCHVAMAANGKAIYIANYSTGNITVRSVEPTGALGDTLPVRYLPGARKWAHMVYPQGSWVYSVDKGADCILQFRVLEGGGLEQIGRTDFPAGSGPRHLDFHPNGQFAYVINELSNTIISLKIDKVSGKMSPFQEISTLPSDFKAENYCADIHVHPSGKFLYGSNRGHDSIAMYRIGHDGKLDFLGTESTQGTYPRNFHITPDGQWLLAANQNSSSICAFAIEQNTGKLRPVAGLSAVKTPVCVVRQ